MSRNTISSAPAWCCLIGFFLHCLLCDPVLTLLGLHYSGDEGQFYEKIHPGTYFIFLGFALLLTTQRSIITQLWELFQQQRAAMALLVFYGFALSYMILRSGAHGLAFILDTHMSAVCCAILLFSVKPATARLAIVVFLLIATLNSGIGIIEAIGKFRLFSYDPHWAVLHEEYFRASALRGHPLDNTLFTIIALCVALHLRMNIFFKAALALFLLASILAFGGRAGAASAVVILALFCGRECIIHLRRPTLRLREFLHIMIALITVAFLVLLVFYMSFASGTAQRLATASHWDDSAASRVLAFHVFNYLSTHDLLFGISTDRILDITWRMHIRYALSDIENPWLLMLMYLGAGLFSLWLISTGAFILHLMKHSSFPLQMAVAAYFIIASSANSFGRKDSTYLIMVCAVLCAKRALLPAPPATGLQYAD